MDYAITFDLEVMIINAKALAYERILGGRHDLAPIWIFIQECEQLRDSIRPYWTPRDIKQ
jgi:hypothetical protein